MKHQIKILTAVFTALLFMQTTSNAEEKENNMKILNMQTTIGKGADKEVTVLFEGYRRKIVQITLRNQEILSSHKANEPITIQCISGKGKLIIGGGKKNIELSAGVLVTIEPNIIHEVTSEPEISILLSKFAE